ncbi:transposase [Rhizobium phaseoli]|uniref:Transposase n=1 Tax=Rhizobium phaseoli TaxID=396 RepID=A0A7K3UDT1_9HYPH|nr:transposase [Rhizobium phaseoli]
MEDREEQPLFAIIDSQSVKTGPDARRDVGYDAGKKLKGRKRHILVDTLGMLLKADVLGGYSRSRRGSPRFRQTRRPLCDGGYQGRKVEEASPRLIS